jgi:hypothetical protein
MHAETVSESKAWYREYDIPLASVECLTHGPNMFVWSEARGYYCCWQCLKEQGLV